MCVDMYAHTYIQLIMCICIKYCLLYMRINVCGTTCVHMIACWYIFICINIIKR